jgi:hypothetical protein
MLSNSISKCNLYLRNFVYDMSMNLQYILFEEGRILPEGDGFRYEYQAKDHLGNVRVVYSDAGASTPQVHQTSCWRDLLARVQRNN